MNNKNNSKYVQSYFIGEHKEGIFSITFNTRIRWMPYKRITNECYFFGPDNKVDDPESEYEGKIQEVDKFLPEGKHFLCTQTQEKDQVTFYFLPDELILDNKLLLEVNVDDIRNAGKENY